MTIPASQREAAAFLERRAGRPPRETAISAVYVGPEEVWKLKKAVRPPFLDFTSLAARERFVRRELALNRPDAPDIYRGVAAIVRGPDGALRLVDEPEDGAALDWVLRMAPIPPQDFLDAVAADGGMSPERLDALADCVARHHAGRPALPDWDSPGALGRVIDGCVASARAAGLPQAQVQAWWRGMRAWLVREAATLAARAAAGCVRRCHGDLHLGNLILWRGAIVPVDALEFDEELASIDVGYDLALLLMDLEFRLGRPAANRVLNRYLARAGDYGLAAPLPLFLSLRAMVRAHVSAAGGQGEAAARYLAAALADLEPRPPLLLAIGGLPGAGKSTVARALAPALGRSPGAVVLRSDELRKRLFGVAPEQRLPADAYAEEANQRVNADLARLAREVAASGQAVIADATFVLPAQRAQIEAAARDAGVPFLGVWLTAPPEVLAARIAARRGDASDADAAVLARALTLDVGRIDWRQVDATGEPAGEIAGMLRGVQ